MDIAKIKGQLLPKITSICAHLKNHIDVKSLTIGLALVFGLYVLLFSYVLFKAEDTIKIIESKLSYETIPVQVIGARNRPTHQKSDLAIDGLYQNTASGLLPIIRRSDNLTSFRSYQRPFSFKEVSQDKPVISFIITDFGLSKEQSMATLDVLPPEISLMLSPYADLPEEWVSMAKAQGHEVWLNLPIQNKDATDLGGNTIFHFAPYGDKLKAFFKTLSTTQGYLGLGSFTDTSLTYSAEDYSKLAEEMYTRGLGFIEMNPYASPVIEGKSITYGAPYIQADMTLLRIKGDDSFDTLEHLAQQKKHAVIVVPNAPNIIKNLAVWLVKVAQADYTIAPVSAMFDLSLYNATQKDSDNSNESHQNIKSAPVPDAITTPTHLQEHDHIQPTENHH
tara:strand:+ start:290 stop:1465 length:1176 start_codon:yes stop_codon:yes gene_type:complete